MTRYEQLKSKADTCVQCAIRCYNNQAFTMAKIWAVKAEDLDKLAKEGAVDEEKIL